MKRILSIALLALFAAQPVFAQTKNKGASQGKGRGVQAVDAEAELKRLEREWFDAVVKGDAEMLNRILAADFTALNDDGSFINKAKMIEILRWNCWVYSDRCGIVIVGQFGKLSHNYNPI